MPSTPWVVLLAFVLWELVFAGFGYWHSPGTRELMVHFLMGPMILGTMSVFTFGQSIWILFVWAVWQWTEWRRYHLRALVMLLPPAACAVLLMWNLLNELPSPQAYFPKRFGVEMPADAQEIKVKASFWVDSGYVDFYFQCSADSTRNLIRQLQVEELSLEGADDDWLLWMPHWGLRKFGVPDPSGWKGRRQYQRQISAIGTGHVLITNASMTEVFISRVPGQFYSDTELAEEAARYKESR